MTTACFQLAHGAAAVAAGLVAPGVGLELGRLGYVVVGLFGAMRVCSLTVWKTRRIEQCWSSLL